MMVVLEHIHPELAALCQKVEDFFEFSKCFTPAIERIPELPSKSVRMKIHLPMSGFVQQFEAPSTEYGLLFSACWPGHVLLSGNGVKGHAPYPRAAGIDCARDSTMIGPCVWLSREAQVTAASSCCLLQAAVCNDRTMTCTSGEVSNHGHLNDTLSCRVGWPVLWAGGGEVVDPSVPLCGAPFVLLKQRGIEWDNQAYLKMFTTRLTSA